MVYPKQYRVIGVLASCLLLLALAAPAEDDAETKGRAIFEKYHEAMVTVELVIKMKFVMYGESEDQESKEEVAGVVIDPSGLIVSSLSLIDPSGIMRDMMSSLDGEDAGFKVESDVAGVKVLLADGTEMPARIVLRDRDLDLAFVRPVEKPKAPMTAIDLSESGEPALMEKLVAIARLGKIAGRAYAAGFEHVHAIVEKPRRFYVPDNDPTHSSLGSPVFSLDGKIVGVIVLRSVKTSSGPSFGPLMQGDMGGGLSIIVPARDILEVAGQAPEAAGKADEP